MLLLRFVASGLAFAGFIQAQVDLGTALSFAVLGGQAVTNTGPSTIDGDVGVSPGSAVIGFPPGTITNGIIHAADAVAAQAQSDVTIAYDAAAGEPSDDNLSGQDLGGLTLVPGVYTFSTSAQLTGTLTLDGQGDSSSVWIFQIGSALNTADAAEVLLIGGASSCNVFWQVGSSATIGSSTSFVGNILALTSITMVTAASSDGGLYARNGAVTLDSNDINAGLDCPPEPITTTANTASTTDTATTMETGSDTTTDTTDTASTATIPTGSEITDGSGTATTTEQTGTEVSMETASATTNTGPITSASGSTESGDAGPSTSAPTSRQANMTTTADQSVTTTIFTVICSIAPTIIDTYGHATSSKLRALRF